MLIFQSIFLSLVLFLLTGCGGGGGGSTNSTSSDTSSSSANSASSSNSSNTNLLVGTVSKGKVTQGSISIFKSDGTLLGTSDIVDGNYSIDIGDYDGNVKAITTILQYEDESNNNQTVDVNISLNAVSFVDSTSKVINVTPLTSIASDILGSDIGTKSKDEIETMNKFVASHLGLGSTDLTKQVVSLVGSGEQNIENTLEKKYGAILNAVANDSNISVSSDRSNNTAKLFASIKKLKDAIVTNDFNKTRKFIEDNLQEVNISISGIGTNFIESNITIPSNVSNSVALAKVLAYAESNGTLLPLSMLDFKSLGINGITLGNVNELNQKIANQNVNGVNSISKIQGIVNTSITEAINGLRSEQYFRYLWHFDSNTTAFDSGQYTLKRGSDINITKAWEMTRGDGVKVAVIDDFFDYTHEDIQANVIGTKNTVEGGTNVARTSGNYTPPTNPNNKTASHGSAVAAFIAAPKNGKGVVGVAPKSKLVLIRINFQEAEILSALQYAKEQNVSVINCSWGTESISQPVENMLKELYDANITVVFASGNAGKNLDGSDSINDESESQYVLGVGASASYNDVLGYSNYGNKIDILAPGGDVIELLSIDDTGEDNGSVAYGTNNLSNLVDHNYSFVLGTSFSAPIVSGVVSLMYSVNPHLTPQKVREIIISTAEKVQYDSANSIRPQEDYNASGFDVYRAYGKINAGKAVEAAQKLYIQE